MAPFPCNPKIIAQSVMELYPAGKDMFLHVRARGRDIKSLEDRLSKLISIMASIMSRKDEIQRRLRNSVFSKKSKEFEVLETTTADIGRKCIEFINTYTKTTRRRLGSLRDEADARCIIEELENVRSKVFTFRFLKLARLSRDIASLSTHACEVLERLNPDRMISKRFELNQERFEVDGDDLAFYDAYVDEVLRYLRGNGRRAGILGGLMGVTVVLKKLFNRLKSRSSAAAGDNLELDFVIWLEILEGEEEMVEKVQNEIMAQLNIDHEATVSAHVNADKISAFLRHKKYIFLVDKVSSNIDLGRVGLREHHEHMMLVVASGDRNVVSLMVDCVFEI